MTDRTSIEWRQQTVESRLAELRQILTPGRLQMREMRDNLRKRCIAEDQAARVVEWWRPGTASEWAEIDAFRWHWMAENGALVDEENRLQQEAKDLAKIRQRIADEKVRAEAARQRRDAPRDASQGSLFHDF